MSKQITLPTKPLNVYLSKQAALESPISELISLTYDQRYLYYFNAAYTQVEYEAELYQNSQHHSDAFKEHMANVANIIQATTSKNAKIVEIGCGKGAFFEMLDKSGFKNLNGFDTSYQGGDNRISKSYFSQDNYGFNADVIILRHTLEHIPNPIQFLEEVFEINQNKKAVAFIEVPCFDWIIDNQTWWDISYEHCNYFKEGFFKALFPSSKVYKVFENQYLLASVKYADLKSPQGKASFTSIRVADLFPFFQEKGDSDVAKEPAYSEIQLTTKERYWVWGAATKCVFYLWHSRSLNEEYLEPVGCIDINPNKHGKYLPCLGYKIFSPTYLIENFKENDSIIVVNPAYLEEVKIFLSNHLNKAFEIFSI